MVVTGGYYTSLGFSFARRGYGALQHHRCRYWLSCHEYERCVLGRHGSDCKFQGHPTVAVPLYHLWAATPYCFEADMQHRLLSGEIARFLMSTSPLWWGDAQKEGIVLKRHSAGTTSL